MRIQLALNVDDLDSAVAFYSKMFGVDPAKIEPGYANFAVADPPLKLVLFEGAGPSGSINHLGVEVESVDEVVGAEARLAAAGLVTTGVDDTVCCFAEKTETWVDAPDGNRWEWYVRHGDAAQLEYAERPAGGTCCTDGIGDPSEVGSDAARSDAARSDAARSDAAAAAVSGPSPASCC